MATEEIHTPEHEQVGGTANGITHAQKQALIDNLQLEITERARKLRAQHALQAQGLRARLEMRVNRIPQALRKRKIQDLLDEYAEKENPKPAPAVPVLQTVMQNHAVEDPPQRSLKRMSDHISTDDDKENQSSQAQDLANPKKRVKKTAAPTNAKASRTVSRKVVPSTVLSPKSHNSRTLPRSPIKPSGGSFEKPISSRPASPVKPSTSQPAKQTQTKQQRGTRAAATTSDSEGRSSGVSNVSSSTTIVKKTGTKGKLVAAATAAGKRAAATAKTVAGGKRVAGATAAKKENVPISSGTGRTLRKRG